ncbi:CDP-alcohol phosphatidyltransferase family protein [Idiomarina sp.]|uniref:CDP-alcohol phosphatidyltransferase family protein n=1 Tax=Idiomarina sp. TaxID=1874361 RepID=UPI0025BE9C33|nr:CDP-alcohol phosphatidyltransferase family protein [Idiomarina sp.]NQZ04589.1 CDP-alcohol phosphatidyltransferase family protein [Idiomarina sp.]
MVDRYLIPPLQRLLDKPARLLVRRAVTANQITLVGFVIGVLALPLLMAGAFELALVAVLLNRLADGLDGAVARRTQTTDAGGFLDIVLDFIFYQAVVVGFILNSPHEHLLPGLFLMLSFVGTGTSFLAFAVQASKRGLDNPHYPNKSMYYMGGLAEGFETFAVFVLLCLLPQHFGIIAWLFGAVCWVTTATRIWAGFNTLKAHK